MSTSGRNTKEKSQLFPKHSINSRLTFSSSMNLITQKKPALSSVISSKSKQSPPRPPTYGSFSQDEAEHHLLNAAAFLNSPTEDDDDLKSNGYQPTKASYQPINQNDNEANEQSDLLSAASPQQKEQVIKIHPLILKNSARKDEHSLNSPSKLNQNNAAQLIHSLGDQVKPLSSSELSTSIALATTGALFTGSAAYHFVDKLLEGTGGIPLLVGTTVAAAIPTSSLSFNANFTLWSKFFRNFNHLSIEDLKRSSLPIAITLVSIFSSFKVNWDAWEIIPIEPRFTLSIGRALFSSLGTNVLFTSNLLQGLKGDKVTPEIRLIKDAQRILQNLASDPDKYNEFIKVLSDSNLLGLLEKFSTLKEHNDTDFTALINELFAALLTIKKTEVYHLLLTTDSPEGKTFSQLTKPTYILSKEKLYYVTDNSTMVTKKNLIRLDSKKTTALELWEQFSKQQIFTNEPPTPTILTREQQEIIAASLPANYSPILKNVAITGGFVAGGIMYVKPGLSIVPMMYQESLATTMSEHPTAFWCLGPVFACATFCVNGAIAGVGIRDAIDQLKELITEIGGILEKGAGSYFQNYTSQDYLLLMLKGLLFIMKNALKIYFIGGYGLANAGMAYTYPAIDYASIKWISAVLSMIDYSCIGSMSINRLLDRLVNAYNHNILDEALEELRRGKMTLQHYYDSIANEPQTSKMLVRLLMEFLKGPFDTLKAFFNHLPQDKVKAVFKTHLTAELYKLYPELYQGCDFLLMKDSPTNRILHKPLYILSADGLYYVNKSNTKISSKELITNDQQILRELWKTLANCDFEARYDACIRSLQVSEQDIITAVTGHSPYKLQSDVEEKDNNESAATGPAATQPRLRKRVSGNRTALFSTPFSPDTRLQLPNERILCNVPVSFSPPIHPKSGAPSPVIARSTQNDNAGISLTHRRRNSAI